MTSTTHSTRLPALEQPHQLDAASQDVVIEVVRALEEQLCTIRAQFPESGGN